MLMVLIIKRFSFLFLAGVFSLVLRAEAGGASLESCLAGNTDVLIEEGWAPTQSQSVGDCFAYSAGAQVEHAYYREYGRSLSLSYDATLLDMYLTKGNFLSQILLNVASRARFNPGSSKYSGGRNGSLPISVIDFMMRSGRAWTVDRAWRSSIIQELTTLSNNANKGVAPIFGNYAKSSMENECYQNKLGPWKNGQQFRLGQPISLSRDGVFPYEVHRFRDTYLGIAGVYAGVKNSTLEKEKTLRAFLCRGVPVGVTGPSSKLLYLYRNQIKYPDLDREGISPHSMGFVKGTVRNNSLWRKDSSKFGWHSTVAVGILRDEKNEATLVLRCSHLDERIIGKNYEKLQNVSAYCKMPLKKIGFFPFFEAIVTKQDKKRFTRMGFDPEQDLAKHKVYRYHQN